MSSKLEGISTRGTRRLEIMIFGLFNSSPVEAAVLSVLIIYRGNNTTRYSTCYLIDGQMQPLCLFWHTTFMFLANDRNINICICLAFRRCDIPYTHTNDVDRSTPNGTWGK
jgi:hypothetical protein